MHALNIPSEYIFYQWGFYVLLCLGIIEAIVRLIKND